MRHQPKPYIAAGLALLVAGTQVVLLAVATGASPVRASAVDADTVAPLTRFGGMAALVPAAVWLGRPVAGLQVARADGRRVILAGGLVPLELRLPAATRRDPVGLAAAQTALEAIGSPYRWGATGARGSFDCSGLIWRAYAQHGVALPRVSREQARAGVPVARSIGALQPGDLLTFARVPGGAVEHVGLYVGGRRFVHSSGWDGAVVVSALAPDDARGRWWWRRWVGARRVEPRAGEGARAL